MVGACGAAALVVAAGALWAYTPDDAYISFSYAQRYAAGDGWVASADTPPVEGFSNPLWVGVLVLAAHAKLDLVLTAKFLGLAAGVLLLFVTARLAVATHERGDWGAWAAPALLATWPPLALWAVSGMENALYGFLLTAGTLGVVREVWDDRRGARSAWWWVAAMWMRPEAFGLAAVAAVWRVTTWRSDRRRALRWLLIVVAGFVMLALWRYTTFGEWLPNTYYAKRNNLLVGHGGAYLWRGAWHAGFGIVVVLAGVAVLARVRRGPAGVHHPVGFLASLVFAQCVFVVQVGGDWMHQFRFLTPLAPFVAVLAGVGAAVVADRLRAIHIRGALVAPLLLCGLWGASWPGAWHGVRTERSVDIVSDAWAPYRAALHGMATALGPGASVVIPELGYPSYATDLRVWDPLGLASAHVAHLRYERADHLLRDVWRPDAIKLHTLVREAFALDRNRWFRDGYLLVGGPPDWQTTPHAVDGWYVRRDLFERDPQDLPPSVALFGKALELRHAAFMPPVVGEDQPLRLLLMWLPLAEPGDWTYRLHIRTPAGVVLTVDRPPLHAWWPTTAWTPGIGIADTILLALETALTPGTYQVALTLQQPGTDEPVYFTRPGQDRTREPLGIGSFDVVAKDSGNSAEALAFLVRKDVTDAMGDADAGRFADAHTAVDRAKRLRGETWEAERTAFVEAQLLRGARDTGWRRVQYDALAWRADPTWRFAGPESLDRSLRRQWASYTRQERLDRRRAGSVWEAARRVTSTVPTRGAPPADAEEPRVPQVVIAPDRAEATFSPPILLDQVRTADVTFAGAIRPAADGERCVIQLGYFGTAGYRVASVPMPCPTDVTPGRFYLACRRVDDGLRIMIGADAEHATAYVFASLAPNPWGASFYPPQTPVLHALALLAVSPGGEARPIPLHGVQVEVGPTAEAPSSDADARAGPAHWIPWQGVRPDVRAFRAYEVLTPVDD